MNFLSATLLLSHIHFLLRPPVSAYMWNTFTWVDLLLNKTQNCLAGDQLVFLPALSVHHRFLKQWEHLALHYCNSLLVFFQRVFKLTFLSSFTHSQVDPNRYDFFFCGT